MASLFTQIWGIDERVGQLEDYTRDAGGASEASAGTTQTSALFRSDDVEGGRLAVQHLLDQGHTAIAVIGGPERLQQVADRRLGARLARSRHNGGLARLFVKSTPHLDVASGVTAAPKEIRHDARPGAAKISHIATNDLLAIGLLQGFVAAG